MIPLTLKRPQPYYTHSDHHLLLFPSLLNPYHDDPQVFRKLKVHPNSSMHQPQVILSFKIFPQLPSRLLLIIQLFLETLVVLLGHCEVKKSPNDATKFLSNIHHQVSAQGLNLQHGRLNVRSQKLWCKDSHQK
jgi:hypothetical protein